MVAPILTPRLSLVPLQAEAIRSLIAGDREAAEEQIHRALPAEFPSADDMTGFLPIQLARMEATPAQTEWMARLIVETAADLVAGHCGFHGSPEVIGRAEIGYTVFKEFRGRGFAKEAARALVDWAFAQGQREVFASVSPDNPASLAVVRAIGFIQVGTQQDEVDGLELVFAVRA